MQYNDVRGLRVLMKRAIWLLAGLLVGGAGPISAPYNLGVTDGTTSVQTPNKLVVSGGTITNSAPGQATLTVTGGVASNAAGTIHQLQFNLDGTNFGAFTLGGDATVNTGTGILTVSKIGGQAVTLGGALTTGSTFSTTGAFSTAGAFSTGGALTFANLTTTGDLLFVSSSGNVGQEATTAITALGTITTGVWNGTAIANANLANSSMTIAGHVISLGGTQAIACGDLSNGATGCSTATGTSGATIPLLNGNNTFSGNLTFSGLTTGSQVSCLGLTAGNAVVASAGGCGTGTGGSLTITDGSNTVSGVTNLSVTGGTVGGTTPNATLDVTGGGGVTFSDGVNSVANATALNFNVGTISGSTPVATINLGTAADNDTGTSGATVPLLSGTNTASGKWTWSASTTARASMNIPLGTAPTSCINGDVWATASGLFGCFSGTPVGPYAPATAGGTTITLGAGLTNTNGTQNTGAQTIANGSSLAPQFWPLAETTNHTATLSDGAGVYLANGGSSITFTLPAATSSTAADGSTGVGYCFGDESGHGYTINTTSSQVIFGFPTATGSDITLAVPANTTMCATSNGTAWYLQAGGGSLGSSGVNPANPTATAGPTAVNGSAATFMRSDAAPAVQKGSAAQFGIVEVDGSTITAAGGVISAVGAAATSIQPGTTTIVGATAPCFIANSATTVMACDALGTGVATALGVNTGSSGAFLLSTNNLSDLTSVVTARSSINVDGRTQHGSNTGTLGATEHYATTCNNNDFACTTGTFGTGGNWTMVLLTSASINDGDPVKIADSQGLLSGTNTLTITANTGDTINNSATYVLSTSRAVLDCKADKANRNWNCTSTQPTGTAGQLLVGQGANTGMAPTTMSGDVSSISSGGLVTLAGVGGTTYPNFGSVTNAVPMAASAGVMTYSVQANAAFASGSAKTANYSVSVAAVPGDQNKYFNNTGAAGTVIFTLPTAAAGLKYTFVCTAAHTLEVLAAGSDHIWLGTTDKGAAGNLQTNAPYSVLKLVSLASGAWFAESATGTWN